MCNKTCRNFLERIIMIGNQIFKFTTAHIFVGIYKHPGFWQCMDTQRDKGMLEGLWAAGRAPWKIWEEER